MTDSFEIIIQIPYISPFKKCTIHCLFTELSNHDHDWLWNIFLPPPPPTRRNSISTGIHSLLSSSEPWRQETTRYFLFLWICLFETFRTHMELAISGLLQLVSFTQHNVFKVHRHSRVDYHFIPFPGQAIVHRVDNYVLFILSLVGVHLSCFSFWLL